MTAILQELRRLDARRKRGDIDPVEYARLKARLKGSVEEAHPVIDGEADEIDAHRPSQRDTGAAAQPSVPPRTGSEPSGGMTWGLGLVICLAVIGICMGFALMLFVDVSFGMTLGVTLLAALTVGLFRSLEEE